MNPSTQPGVAPALPTPANLPGRYLPHIWRLCGLMAPNPAQAHHLATRTFEIVQSMAPLPGLKRREQLEASFVAACEELWQFSFDAPLAIRASYYAPSPGAGIIIRPEQMPRLLASLAPTQRLIWVLRNVAKHDINFIAGMTGCAPEVAETCELIAELRLRELAAERSRA